jgi:hypothetical protein
MRTAFTARLGYFACLMCALLGVPLRVAADASPECSLALGEWINGTYPTQQIIASYSSLGVAFDAGNFDACKLAVGAHYCRVGIAYDPTAILHVGLCAPQACNGGMLASSSSLRNLFVSPAISYLIPPQNAGVSVACTDEDTTFWSQSGACGVVALLAALTLLVLTASYVRWKREKDDSAFDSPELAEALLDQAGRSARASELSMGAQLLDCFALQSSWSALNTVPSIRKKVSEASHTERSLEVSAQRGQSYSARREDKMSSSFFSASVSSPVSGGVLPLDLSALNGLRVLSILSIIWYHTYVIQFATYKNITYFMAEVLTTFWFQFTDTCIYAVDTFLMLSSFLGIYFLLKEYDATVVKGETYSWGKFYLHRYVRLTPVLGFWILMQVTHFLQVVSQLLQFSHA